MTTPLILLTNDDGIKSPGLWAAAEAVMELGEIFVVAPTTQQTSMSQSLCGNDNERLHKIDYKINGRAIPAYHADCSPAQLIIHALQILFSDRKPNLLVSGINYGENLGSNISISATCGAAFQAASEGISALAVSLQTDIKNHFKHADLDWDTAKHFTRYFTEMMLGSDMPDDVDVVNINVPADACLDTSWKITRQSRQPYFVNRIKNLTLESEIGDGQCVIGFDENKLEPDSDIHAIANGHVVSVTPLSIDKTSRMDLNGMNKIFKM